MLQSQATLLAEWTFETSVPATAGPHSAEGGVFLGTSSPASGFHAGATAYSNPAGAGSVESFSSTAWAVGDYYQFQSSSAGYENIVLKFKATSSNTGPKDFRLAYSTDGSTYTLSSTYSVLANASPNTVWAAGMTLAEAAPYEIILDLSSVGALDNQSTVFFRLLDNSTISANGGVVAAGGTSRVDDFTISGDLKAVVPEASTWFAGLGLSLGMLGTFVRKHRK